jgi:hypothetical protein
LGKIEANNGVEVEVLEAAGAADEQEALVYEGLDAPTCRKSGELSELQIGKQIQLRSA